MLLRAPRLIATLLCLALGAALIGPASTGAPTASRDIAAFRTIVERAAARAWAGSSGRAPLGRANVLIQLQAPPLGVMARTLSSSDQAAYAATIASAQGRLASAVEAAGGHVLGRFNTAVAGLAANIDGAQVAALRARPDVLAILPIADYAIAQGEAAAPATLDQVAELIGSDAVHLRGADGAGIDIAIVDSGIDYTHDKLGGPASADAYYRAYCGGALLRPGDPSCDPSLDPPPDLFPNAVVRGGYDYLGDVWPAPDPRCPDSAVCTFVDANPIDGAGHGTHVADITAGRAGNAGYGTGIAPGANLWAFKACNGAAQLCEGSALLLALDNALDLDGSNRRRCRFDLGEICAAYDPADVIVLAVSYSYGQPEDALTLFADLASFYGSLVVAAAGNDGDQPYVVGTPAVAAASLAVAESTLGAGDPPAEAPAASTSRGPRIADSALKPDLAAPGAIISAAAGSGAGVAPFGGSSGAAPVVAGVAALVIQELERLGSVDPAPGLRDSKAGGLSLAPLVKTVLMNNAARLRSDGALAPASRIGSGRVNAFAAFRARTLAVDATAISALFASTPALTLCSITPYVDLVRYLYLNHELPPCARAYPGGDALLNAWNAQTGSISFGYQAITDTLQLQHTVAVMNYSRFARDYTLSVAERAPAPGVTVAVSPTELHLEGNSVQTINVTLSVDAASLRSWAAAGGQPYEVDGLVSIDGGINNRIALPWHLMPHRAAAVTVARSSEAEVVLRNPAPAQDGAVETFALVDMSPNQCDQRDINDTIVGSCASLDYRPGDRPGSHESPPDLENVGVRGRSVAGLNATYGLPAAPAGAIPDEEIAFAVSLYDQPYRTTPLTPLRIEVAVDADRDGGADYLVTSDATGAVLVRDVNLANGTLPDRTFGALDADYHTQWIVLPVPAAAIGLRSDRPFSFVVRAYDARFGERAWDCSPGPLAACGAAAHTFQTGAPAFSPASASLSVPAGGRATLTWEESPSGAESPAQLGLLLLLRDSRPGAGVLALRLR